MQKQLDNDYWNDMRKRLQKAQLLILGEMHGAFANTQIASEFIQRIGIKTVLIEVDSKYSDLFPNLSVNNIGAIEAEIRKSDSWLFEAGVLSSTHLQLHATLCEQGIRVIPIKIEDKDWNTAEQLTSDKIRKLLATATTPAIAIIGRLHARNKCYKIQNKPYAPLGWLLRDIAISVQIRYVAGEIYNFGRISVSDKSATKFLGNKNKILKKSQNRFFDFDYIVRTTRPLK